MLSRFPALLILLTLTGCVQRTIRVTSEPPGATVFLDGEVKGETPFDIPFTWYGDREILLEKTGYHSLRSLEPVPAPWWQYFPIDFLLDVLLPIPVHDKHQFHYDLTRDKPIQKAYEETKRHADEFRRKAIHE